MACGYPSAVRAQSATVRMRVINEDGKAIPFANVVITDVAEQARVLGVIACNEEGRASLTLVGSLAKFFVYISAVGYESYQQAHMVDNSQELTIQLKTSVIKLQEVKVQARIQKDTLLLDIAKMNLKKKATLRDILERTTGMIVSKEGGIFFQGKQIKRILINGKEVFLDQNKIALDNLNYEIMDEVEVIQNFKDRFSLDFNTIKESVINVNTKSAFKGVLKGEIELGLGHRESFSAKGKGFYFSDVVNTFATSNTNTAGKQDLAINEVIAPFVSYPSSQLKNSLLHFFEEETQVRKNLIGSHSLTLRQEGKRYKSGLVLYQGMMNVRRESSSRLYRADSLFRNYESAYQDRGNFWAASLEHNRRLTTRSVLQNNFSFLLLNRRLGIYLADTVQQPVREVFQQDMQAPLRDVIFNNNLKYTYLLSPKVLLTLQGDFFSEHNRSNLHLQVLGDSISQRINLIKQYVDLRSSLQFRLQKLTLTTGLNLGYQKDNSRLNRFYTPMTPLALERRRLLAALPIGLRIVKGKIEYDGRVTAELNRFAQSEGKFMWPTIHHLIYNIDGKDNVSLELSRLNRFYELDRLFDTIIQDYHSRLINVGNNTNSFLTQEEVVLSWSHTDAVKDLRHRYKYSYAQTQNFRQNVLDSIRGQNLYYGNYSFPKRYTHTLALNSAKFFYVGESYHNLMLEGGLVFKYTGYPTLLDNKTTRAHVNSWNPQLKVLLNLRDYFIHELKYSLDWYYDAYWMAQEKRMQQKEMLHHFFIQGAVQKLDWEADFRYRYTKVNTNLSKVADASLRFKYNWSDRFSLSLLGESLLSLFRLNSYNRLQIQVDGNMLSQQVTNNNLGYLMLTAAIKL